MMSSVISGNHVSALSPNGTVFLVGGGIQSGGPLTLRNSRVSENTGDATGLSGTAQGGGIFAGDIENGPPVGPLNLTNSSITHNVLSGSSGITLQGGGVFTTHPVTLRNSIIAQNTPDQCYGC
jgi:hypothetical protein